MLGSVMTHSMLVLGLSVALDAAAGPPTRSNGTQICEHFKTVRTLLPPHSALPPSVDLSKPAPAPLGAPSKAWERKFENVLGLVYRGLVDPGVPAPDMRTSFALDTKEYIGPLHVLDARDCDAVVIGTPISSSEHVASNNKFAYASYSVMVGTVLKSTGKHIIREGQTITAVAFGGTVVFPSGQMETFITSGDGFPELGKPHVLFIWRGVKSDDTYVIDQGFIVNEGLVNPIEARAGASVYDGMPFDKFLKKVKNAIAENVNE